MNYYKLLEVDRDASPEVIEKAYKTLVKKYHPDLQESNMRQKSEEKLKLINEAYEVLSNPDSRAKYDATLKQSEVSEEDFNRLSEENRNLYNEINNLKHTTNNINNTYNNNYNNDVSNSNNNSNYNTNDYEYANDNNSSTNDNVDNSNETNTYVDTNNDSVNQNLDENNTDVSSNVRE